MLGRTRTKSRAVSTIARSARQATLLAWLTVSAWASPVAADDTAAAVPWKELDYGASKLLLSTSARIALARLPREQALPQLLAPGEGVALQPQGSEVVLMSVSNSFMGQDSRIQFWLNPDGSTLQRTTVYTGRRLWYRTYRYTETGVYSLKRRPRSGEERLAPEQWTDVAKNFYRHDPAPTGSMITSAEALFYMLANTEKLAKPGDELLFHAFTKTGIAVVRLHAEDRTNIPAKFTEQGPEGTKQVEGDIPVLRIALTSRPLSPDRATEDLDLLGLHGDTTLYFDTARRLVLQLSGQGDVVGALDIKLTRVSR